MNIHKSVQDRYADGAEQREAELCCPIDYDPQYLKIIPQEVLDRDYGCGDPSRYVRAGETVLDLGAGGGKICFIAAQIVGEKGKVIGVDMTPEMLELSRGAAPIISEALGYDVVEFRRGHIQDLKTNLDLVDAYLAENPVSGAEDFEKMQAEIARLQTELPLVADNSVDVIVSNCVLNLVDDSLKKQLFSEMYRVLKIGGRIAVSDIVSDEISPQHLKDNKKLWSGCISGALQEAEFVKALEEAGFYGVSIDKYEETPWQIVEGIEYRSVTILAWKGKEGKCIEKNQAVIYKGPFKQIEDDDGHVYLRGERMAVCEKTFKILSSEPYKDMFIAVSPSLEVEGEEEFDCARPQIRPASETKSGLPKLTSDPQQSCC